MSTPTPKTDAFEKQYDRTRLTEIFAEKMRELERELAKVTEERDEARADAEKERKRREDSDHTAGSQSNLLCNIGDTLRSRGYGGTYRMDERVIALAQDRDKAQAERDRLAAEKAALEKRVETAKSNAQFLLEDRNRETERANALERERDELKTQVDRYVEGLRKAFDERDARGVQLAEAREALGFIEEALKNMPDLEITYREDGDEEDSIGLVPQGWNFRCDSVCVEPLTVNADSFGAMLRKAKQLLKGAGEVRPSPSAEPEINLARSLQRRLTDALAQIERLTKELESAEEGLRGCCLLLGFDISDGEGTSPEEVVGYMEAALKERDAQIERLRSALENAKADTERMDWVHEHWELVWQRIAMSGWWYWDTKNKLRGSKDTLREAIDAARAALNHPAAESSADTQS